MIDNKTIKEYYDISTIKEWERLEGFHFEFEITKRMLDKYMKKGKILDIGGGPGRYSLYLSSLGFDVTLVDLSLGNVNFAINKAKEEKLNLKAYEADARDLSSLPLEKYDTILLMGPLYHLSKTEERIKCLEEAKKYLKEDGVLFVSFISLPAGLLFYLDECPYEMPNEKEQNLIDCMEKEKSWSGKAFTDATFTEIKEIEPFFDSLGFKKISLFAQEGITGPRLSYLEKGDDKVKEYYLDVAYRLSEIEEYLPYSPHIIYVGKIK
ncbi:MAG: class I SAM-dependent methyltransferase [Bacillales bacterium]|nr:class I SAM-dependent methyltransferase [Bacillales bacterium]